MLAVVAISILFTWFACSVVLIGISSLLPVRIHEKFHLTDAFWTGLAAAVAVLGVYHFLRPVDTAIVSVLACLGLWGVLRNRIWLARRIREACANGIWHGLSFVAITVVIALRAAGQCEHYDTGFYGAAAVRWF